MFPNLIRDIIKNNPKTISFEVFPPKEDASYETVINAIEQMAVQKPDFISVTYGAGGGTSKNTVNIATDIQNKYNVTALAHLTCVSSTKKEIEDIIHVLKQHNIKNILALRGDILQGHSFPTPKHYHFAYDLIKEIKQYGSFCIGGACYPEGHIESKDLDFDIDCLKQKIDAGCDFLITQLFFDNNYFYRFMDRLIKKNITIPVIAGIMPVTNSKQIKKICMLSGATIPDELRMALDNYKNGEVRDFGMDFAKKQISDLIDNGVKGIHIYTMNKPSVAKELLYYTP